MTFVFNGAPWPYLHQTGEELQELRGDDDGFVRNDPGDGLLAAGLGEAPLVLDELRHGGDEGGEGHRLEAGPGPSIKQLYNKNSDKTLLCCYIPAYFSLLAAFIILSSSLFGSFPIWSRSTF